MDTLSKLQDTEFFEHISHLDPLKPTVSARKECELLMALTSRVEHLDLRENRDLFVSRIHIPTLTRYLHDITVCRNPGHYTPVASVTSAQLKVSGYTIKVNEVEGKNLADIWLHSVLANSCNYCEAAMQDWSSHWLFLELSPAGKVTSFLPNMFLSS